MIADPRGRIREFEREIVRRTSTSTEPTSFGTAFLNADVPRRFDSNFLWVEQLAASVEADAVAADADRVLGEAGLAHREIRVDDEEAGGRLAPAFLDLGWSADRFVVMGQSREPEPRPPIPTRLVGFDVARPIVEETLRRQPHGEDEEAHGQLVAFRATLERALGARFVVADLDGRPASVCELYVLDGVAQIEDVNTLAEHRGRGLASAVVLAAADAARADGCDLVFLVADDADWPKRLYTRLGFVPLTRYWSFLSWPR